jgi:UDP-N-acetylmuramate dehydrogenase
MPIDRDSINWLIKMFGSRIKLSEPMSKHTYFRVGGPAEALIYPESIRKLKEVLRWAADKKIPYTVIGDGSNLLVKDGGIPGIVLVLTQCLNEISYADRTGESVLIKAMAGVRTQTLCRFAIEEGLSGLNFALGIPGTVGGAIMMNAGTARGTISEVLDSVNILLPSGTDIGIKRENLDFSYRKLSWNKYFTEPAVGETEMPVIIDGCFRLVESDPAGLKRDAEAVLKKRKENQPTEKASAGCFFKNPPSDKTAGQLIDMAGLKGMRIGDAEVSPKHANFIINTGAASSSDIIELMRFIQESVFKKFNVSLEPEVKIIGI